MKLAVIYTGGTISSEAQDGFLSPTDKTKANLIEALDNDIQVESFQPYYILSEQLDGENITALVECVEKRLNEDFDGIIVTHGTDTLQYSAAALSVAFGMGGIPIVVVSSNYILSDKRSNGLSNFTYAVKFIREKIGGVFVSYKNNGGNPEIFTADSLLPHSPYSDKLTAVNKPFGYFEGEKFIQISQLPKLRSEGVFTLTKKSPVLWLKAHPGMRYPESAGYKAVLIESYHSGTLPTEDKEFIEFCEKSTVPIYVIGVGNEIPYESTKYYKQLNIVVLEKISPIYAYILLWKRFQF